MDIILTALDQQLFDAWRTHFENTPVIVKMGDLFEPIVRTNGPDYRKAIVSPANSFGMMDGGVDDRIRHFFRLKGIDVEANVRQDIKRLYGGELPIGCATIIFGEPAVIAAPTMRIPGCIVGTANVYMATRAALECAKKTELDMVVFPGMGTGTGEVKPYHAAIQMRIAYDIAIQEEYPELETWEDIMDFHKRLMGLTT